LESNISIQLFTVREQLAENFDETLRRLAQTGYHWVEPFQGVYKDKKVEDLRSRLEYFNLKFSGSHANIKDLKNDLNGILKYLSVVGCPHLVCSRAEYSSEEEIVSNAAFFNETARKAKDFGMAFSYHNHGHEFERYGGKYILDILLENTDPALVGLELDVFWAAKAGADPEAFQNKWKDRSILLHCKDMSASPESTFAAVGTGVLDFPAIINAASNVKWFVVEQDKSDDPIRDVEVSFKTLTELLKGR
jgi:sugar phosphate isomerase/epimerase